MIFKIVIQKYVNMLENIKIMFYKVLEKFRYKYCDNCDEIIFDGFCDYCTVIR